MNLFNRLVIAVFCSLIVACGNGSATSALETKKQDATIEADKRPSVLKELTRKILVAPDDVSLYNARAIYYIQHQQLKEAFEDLKVALSKDSSYVDLYITLANYYIEEKQPAGARRALEDGLIKNQGNTKLMLQLGEFYMVARKDQLSFQYINDVLKKDKYNARAYFLKGMNYKYLLNEAKALSSFQTAIEQNPDYFEAYMQLGLLYAAQHNPLATQYFTSAIRLQEKNPEAWYARAMFYQEHKAQDKAVADYKSILAFDSTYFNAWYNLGYLQYEKGHLDSAYTYFDRSLTKHYEAKGYYMRGLCQEELGNKAKALKDYQNALKVDANFALAAGAITRVQD